MAWLEDVVLGAISHGVNLPTAVVLNIVLALAVGSLLILLLVSFYSHPALVPHVIVLLVLAVGLWVSINWFISNVGLVAGTSLTDEQTAPASDAATAAATVHDSSTEGQQAGNTKQRKGTKKAQQ
jgi:hypothetical protein